MVDVFRRVRDGIRTALAVLRESNSDEPDLRDVSVVLDMDIGADDPPTAPASAPASPVATRGAKRLAPEAPPQSAREETPERAPAPGSAAASAGEGESQSSSSPAFSRTVRPRRTASPRRSPYAARGASRANDDSYQVDPDPERLARLLEDTSSPDVQSELCLPDADRVVASARPPLSELVMRAYVPTDLQMLVCEALCRNASRTHAGAAGSTGSLTLRTLVADASVVAPEHQPVWGRSHGKYQWIDHRPLYAEARSRRSNPSPRSASPRDEESDTDSESGESEVVVGPDDFHGSMYTEALARLIMASSRCMSQLTVRVPPGVGSMVLLPPAIGACAFLTHLCLDGVADVPLMFPLIARATRLRHLEIRNSFAVHQDAHLRVTLAGAAPAHGILLACLFTNLHWDGGTRRGVLGVDVGHEVGHVQERCAVQPDVDEGRLHAGQHAHDAAEIDVADEAARGGALDVDFLRDALLQDRDACFLRREVDQYLFWHGEVPHRCRQVPRPR